MNSQLHVYDSRIARYDYVDWNEKTSSSLWHSGDKMDDKTRVGHHRINAKLSGVPGCVSHLFFVLSSFRSPSIGRFPNPTVKFYDACDEKRELPHSTFEGALNCEALVMCCVSRVADRHWLVFEGGQQSAGNTHRQRSRIRILLPETRLAAGGDWTFYWGALWLPPRVPVLFQTIFWPAYMGTDQLYGPSPRLPRMFQNSESPAKLCQHKAKKRAPGRPTTLSGPGSLFRTSYWEPPRPSSPFPVPFSTLSASVIKVSSFTSEPSSRGRTTPSSWCIYSTLETAR